MTPGKWMMLCGGIVLGMTMTGLSADAFGLGWFVIGLLIAGGLIVLGWRAS